MRSGLKCKAEGRWSGISGGDDVELWLICAYLRFWTSRNSPSLEPIHLSEGWSGYPRRDQGYKVSCLTGHRRQQTQHNDLEHNVKNHLDISVLLRFRSIDDPSSFNVQESILARLDTVIWAI